MYLDTLLIVVAVIIIAMIAHSSGRKAGIREMSYKIQRAFDNEEIIRREDVSSFTDADDEWDTAPNHT